LSLLGAGLALTVVAAACGQSTRSAAPPSHHRQHAGSPSRRTTTSPTTDLHSSPTTVPMDSPATADSSTTTVLSTSQPVGTTTTTVGAASTAFRGVFEFAGNNSGADAANPDLAGVVLVYYWSQIEPTKGTFDWSVIQHDMAPWVAAGKKVILRISTSGSASWDPPYSGSGTPSWVFGDGTRSIADNGETLPVYWDPAYLTDYQSFVHSFALQFDGNPNVAFIEAGIGMGGETLAETNASHAGIASWEAAGYTDSLWLTTVEKIASFFAASFHTTPIFPLVDMTFFDGSESGYASLLSWLRAQPNWGLQYDGLTSTQKLSSQWTGRPLALEQRDATSTSHDCLCGDISNGLANLHGNYLLIYRSDIVAPSNAATLRQTEATAQPG
jgi:Beta-galactosidase